MRFSGRVVVLSVLLIALTISIAAAADAKGVEGTPQGTAYRALMKTIADGDYEAMKKCMTKASAEGIEKQTKEMGMDPKKGMEMMKVMTPSDLKLTGLKVDGKKATLQASGMMDKELNKGTILLEEEGGQWKVASQSWTNAK